MGKDADIICNFCSKKHKYHKDVLINFWAMKSFGALKKDWIYFCRECSHLIPVFEAMKKQFAKDWTNHQPLYSYTKQEAIDLKQVNCKLCSKLIKEDDRIYSLHSKDNVNFFYLCDKCNEKYLKKLAEQIEYFIEDNQEVKE